MLRARLAIAFTAVAALLAAAPASLADSSTSSNWAGYAAHRAHVKFHRVFAWWVQPSLTCTPGHATYSAFWVGLGGFSLSSNALEQAGTEADCNALGQTRMAAWYELVPAPSRRLTLKVSAGDRIAATVTVTGHKVTIELVDGTTNKSVTKTIRASAVDVSSAEWIAEAPSDCVSVNACVTLPLADFGSASFVFAGAQVSGARVSPLSSSSWKLTKITLEPGSRRFTGINGSGSATAVATPTALSAAGNAFTVTYTALTAARRAAAAAAAVSSGHLFH
jgi:hypothetical protein